MLILACEGVTGLLPETPRSAETTGSGKQTESICQALDKRFGEGTIVSIVTGKQQVLFPHDGPETAPTETETAKQKFERERLTRRQALKRFGLTSAMTAFALFSVDDLARMVGAAMERQAKNNKVTEQVAKEFQGMGVASAAASPSYTTLPPWAIGEHCKGNINTYGKATSCAQCCQLGCDGDYASGSAAEGCITTAEGYC